MKLLSLASFSVMFMWHTEAYNWAIPVFVTYQWVSRNVFMAKVRIDARSANRDRFIDRKLKTPCFYSRRIVCSWLRNIDTVHNLFLYCMFYKMHVDNHIQNVNFDLSIALHCDRQFSLLLNLHRMVHRRWDQSSTMICRLS